MYPLMPGIFQRQWKQLVSAAQSEPSFWAKRSNLARVLAVERRGCHLLTLRGLIKACSKQSVVAMLSTSAPTKCTAPSAEDWGSGVLQVVLPETGRLAAAAERRASTAAVESKEISLAKKSVASIAFDVDVSMSSLDTLVTEGYRWKLMFVEHRYIIWCDNAHVMIYYMHMYAIHVPGSGAPPPHPSPVADYLGIPKGASRGNPLPTLNCNFSLTPKRFFFKPNDEAIIWKHHAAMFSTSSAAGPAKIQAGTVYNMQKAGQWYFGLSCFELGRNQFGVRSVTHTVGGSEPGTGITYMYIYIYHILIISYAKFSICTLYCRLQRYYCYVSLM